MPQQDAPNSYPMNATAPPLSSATACDYDDETSPLVNSVAPTEASTPERLGLGVALVDTERPLDTIDRGNTISSHSSRSLDLNPTMNGADSKAVKDEAKIPLSVDTKQPPAAASDNIVKNGGSGEAVNNGNREPKALPQDLPRTSRKSRRHRRTNSEDLHRYQHPESPVYYGGVPMQQQVPFAAMHNPMMPGAGMPPPQMNRDRSWSGTSQPYMMNLAPPASFSPAGNPLVPILVDNTMGETGPLLQKQKSTSSRRKRKGHPHRRSHSTSAATPGHYGSFFHGDGSYGRGDAVPPPPPPPVHANSFNGVMPMHSSNSVGSANSYGNPRDFSPRGEIMSLTASFRKTTPPQSPRSPMKGASRVSFSPGGPYGEQQPPLTPRAWPTNDMVEPSKVSPVATGSLASEGGEAVFLAQNRGSIRGRERKRHMRQQSAQLFMEDFKGVEQPPACRDIIFVLLFLFHLVGVVFLGNTYGQHALSGRHNNNNEMIDIADTDVVDDLSMEVGAVTFVYNNVVFIACSSGAFAVTVSALALVLMTMIARRFVQVALILAITLSFAWGTIGIGLSPKNVVPITGIIALGLTVAYAFTVWDRIPFCAANLVTALSGLKANPGALVVAFIFQALTLGWSIYYTLVVVGVYDALQSGDLDLSGRMQGFVYAMLFVSFYWTFHVLMNIVQVTVAGIIGGWWYTPFDDKAERSQVATSSFFRAIFYGFGSICFGSLLVGPVRLIRQLSVLFRPSSDDSALLCLHECMHCIQTCVASCVDGLSDHFNPWAFTYIGLYGYGLVDAGHNATELFKKRGWSMIVSDDLVPNILLMMSLVIGGITGCFAEVLENINELKLSSLDNQVVISFVIGVAVGLVVTSVLFGCISASVNTVIVCFAASPVDFEHNHPEHSQDMRAAWREVWPGCMDVVDLRVALANPQTMSPAVGAGGVV